MYFETKVIESFFAPGKNTVLILGKVNAGWKSM